VPADRHTGEVGGPKEIGGKARLGSAKLPAMASTPLVAFVSALADTVLKVGRGQKTE
jgi:hypothetical protein